jgi:hypothetical protein
MFFDIGEHFRVNHLGLYGDTSDTFKPEPCAGVELSLGLDPSYNQCGFDAHTPLARVI